MYIFSDTFFTTRHPLFPALPLLLSPALFFLCTIITFYFWIGLSWIVRFLLAEVADAGEVCLALKVFLFCSSSYAASPELEPVELLAVELLAVD